jgi:4'-phosphopantetheinyl transferase EntD
MEELLPIEVDIVKNTVASRRREFSTGRACARVALSRLGVQPAAIPADEHRAPVWPDGVIGSLSHTRGHTAVAVAHQTRYASIGLDIEAEGRLDDSLVEMICTTEEVRSLRRGSMPLSAAALYVFSAKESFYKCQYPLTHRMLEFHDVQVELELERDRFRVQPLVELPELALERPVVGRFARCCQLIATGVALEPIAESRHPRGVRSA